MADPDLPPGYRLDRSDPDIWVLRRRDGSEVATFSAAGAHPRQIELGAWSDYSRLRRGLLRDAVLDELKEEIRSSPDRFGDDNFKYSVLRLIDDIQADWKEREEA